MATRVAAGGDSRSAAIGAGELVTVTGTSTRPSSGITSAAAGMTTAQSGSTKDITGSRSTANTASVQM